MCTRGCIDFARDSLTSDDVHGKSVIEVGSQDVGGSVRRIVEALQSSSYLGVDVCKGVGVDIVCNVYDLVSTSSISADTVYTQ